MQFDSEKPDKITRGACACNDDKVIFENPLIYSAAVFRVPGMNWDSRVWDGTCPAPGGLSKKLHAKAAAEKQQSITLVNQSFDERKIVVLRSDARRVSTTLRQALTKFSEFFMCWIRVSPFFNSYGAKSVVST